MNVKHVFFTASRHGCVEEPLKLSPAATLATYSGDTFFSQRQKEAMISKDSRHWLLICVSIILSFLCWLIRKRSPYKWRSGVNVLRRNSIRLAEVFFLWWWILRWFHKLWSMLRKNTIISWCLGLAGWIQRVLLWQVSIFIF